MRPSSVDTYTYRSPGPARLLLSHRLFAPVAGAAMLAMIAMPSAVGASPDHQTIQAMPAAGVVTDTDGDGLSDGLEADLGTDPTKADTDGDLSDDGDEYDYGSDPLDPSSLPFDLDGDLLSDEQEAELGTDPLDPDTDDDGLSDFGEVGFEPGSGTGTDPLDADTDDDGFLDGVEVQSGSDPTDPNSTPGNTPAPNSDNDKDGLTYLQEVGIGTDPDRFDTDGDGLGDGAEYREDGWNTDPLKADTDGDGYNDGDELFTYGTDPNNPNDFPADAQAPAPSSSAQPTAKPSTGTVVSGLPSTGTGSDMTSSDSGLMALLASGFLATVAAAVGLRRRRA